MSAQILFNLLNKFGKRDKMCSLPSILSLFRSKLNKFINTGALMLNSIYHIASNLLKITLWMRKH